MQIAIIKDGKVFRIDNYKNLFPNTSFPISGPTTEWLSENSCMLVSVQKQYDSNIQKVENTTPYIENNVVYTVKVVNLNNDELTNKNNLLAGQIREKRNRLLLESDWTQVEDSPVDRAAWAVYRDMLRNITKQPNFPTEFAWPQQPN